MLRHHIQRAAIDSYEIDLLPGEGSGQIASEEPHTSAGGIVAADGRDLTSASHHNKCGIHKINILQSASAADCTSILYSEVYIQHSVFQLHRHIALETSDSDAVYTGNNDLKRTALRSNSQSVTINASAKCHYLLTIYLDCDLSRVSKDNIADSFVLSGSDSKA